MGLDVSWARWATFFVAVSVLVAVVAASLLVPVDIDSFTSDVVQLGGVNRFAGAVSQLGLFGWCAAASVCAFTAFALRGRAPRGHVLFMSYSAMLSAWLLLDDAFLLHEWNEVLAFSLLGMAVLAYLWRFAPLIRTTLYVYLLVALSGLGLSMAVDVMRELLDLDFLKLYINWGSWEHLCEDGPKWIGIVYWCSYFCQTAWLLLKRGVPQEAAIGNHPGDPGAPEPPTHQGPGF